MITAEEAALRAELLIEFPADDPAHGWELEEFPQGWLVNGRDWEEYRGQFAMVIERETGLVRYFTTPVPPWQIVTEYEAVREYGRPDDRWEEPAAPARPRTGRTAPGQPPRTRSARRPGAVHPRR